MKKRIIALLIATVATSAAAHDMFLKPVSFYAEPDTVVPVDLVTGTFDKSLNPVTQDRMADVSVSTGGAVSKPDPALWTHTATSSHVKLKVGAAGTYALGLSSKPSVIKLTAKEFEEYLRHDGIDDVLTARAAEKSSAPVAERYSKHVRAVVQVGATLTDDAARPLGYPAEILLLDNPAALKPGGTLNYRVLYQGKPLGGQLVYGSREGFHGHADAGGQVRRLKRRPAADGPGSIRIDQAGKWYLTLIHMHRVNEPGVDYESDWSTVTFQVR